MAAKTKTYMVLFAACGSFWATFAFSAGNAKMGHELVRKHCVRCHIVDESNRFTGISSTPSFKTLITALPDWLHRFETFYARNPHPSIIRIEGIAPPTAQASANRPVYLSQSDVEAILAYIEEYAKSLKK